jgi:hypothetical protein
MPVLAAAAAAALLACSLVAGTSAWNDPGDGNWNETSKWTPNSSQTDGQIANGATVTINGVEGMQTYANFSVTNNSGLRLINMHADNDGQVITGTLTMTNATLYVEGSDSGNKLTMESGGILLTDTTVNIDAGSSLYIHWGTIGLSGNTILNFNGNSESGSLGPGYLGAGSTLTFTDFTGKINLNLNNVPDGDYSLLSAESFSGITPDGLFAAITVTGDSASRAEVYVSEEFDDLRVKISSVPEPAAFAAFAGLAILAWALTGRRRRE